MLVAKYYTFLVELYLAFVWVFYAALEGHREAWHWYYKTIANNEDKTPAHAVFTIQRALVGLVIFQFHYIVLNGDFGWNLIAFMVLSFPFIHDGYYYWHRDMLKPGTYPKRFFDHSKTSTAFFTKYFPASVRIACFIIAVLCIIFKF